MILVYDGSFEGFLTLVYEVYYKKLKAEKILREIPQLLLMEELITIETDIQKATKVLTAIKTKFDKKNFELILNIFMCDTKEFEFELLRYIMIGFKDKNELFNINNNEVFFLQNLEKELFRSIHKMYGFTRFEELEDNTLYAKIDTKFNLVYFLGKHFFKRLNNQNFIIHDLKRELAFIKVGQKTSIEKVVDFEQPTLSENEEKFTKLWNRFFNAVTIESRENKKCQQNFVPFIYRTYMTEFL
ncbi:TIGR03915 family putative DNA repair protein [Campylobacterota bacterium DY0563]